ncbi:MAG: hypothetical protein Gyms2KO_22230 [Gymnodinialimonas sp.]
MSTQEQKPVATSGAPRMDPLVVTSSEAAHYVERMCCELAGLADRSGLGFLAYLLEVAREEAVLHCDAPSTQPRVMHGELPPS